MTKIFGLIGSNLTNSFSADFYNQKFILHKLEYRYNNFTCKSIDEVIDTINLSPIAGLNITIPYKTAIIPYINQLSDEAYNTGAVNCILKSNHIVKGFNTDVYGFYNSLTPLLQNKTHHKAIIFGNGGAAKAVAYVLNQLKINFITVARNLAVNFNSINKQLLAEHTLWINSTPVGMYDNQTLPLDYSSLTSNHLCYDLIYNSNETPFLSACKKHGAQIKNGLEMLYLQAEKSWEIWQEIL